MDNRGIEERLATLRIDIEQYDPGLRLSDEEVDEAEKLGAKMLRLLYGANAVNDGRTINVLCDIAEPRLTTILYSTSPEENTTEERKDNGCNIIS